jgi:hypothetical protein
VFLQRDLFEVFFPAHTDSPFRVSVIVHALPHWAKYGRA